MKVICTNCHNVSETEVELAVGQHVICPFCGIKFSYKPPPKHESLWQKFKRLPRGKQILIVCGIILFMAMGGINRNSHDLAGRVEKAVNWYVSQMDKKNLQEISFFDSQGSELCLDVINCSTQERGYIKWNIETAEFSYPDFMTKKFAKKLIEERWVIEIVKPTLIKHYQNYPPSLFKQIL